MRTTPHDHTATIHGVSVTVRNVPTVLTDGSPPAYVRGTDGDGFIRLFALAVVRAGASDADAFRRVRAALKLRVDEVARLLEVEPAVVTAWDRGDTTPDRSAFALLAAMLREQMGDPGTIREHLAAMAAHTTPATVTLDWSHDHTGESATPRGGAGAVHPR